MLTFRILNNLFKNIVIFVNGYTGEFLKLSHLHHETAVYLYFNILVPSSDELKRLMKKHGGGYQHYYSRSKCTHIIATNLPDSKIKELRFVGIIVFLLSVCLF